MSDNGENKKLSRVHRARSEIHHTSTTGSIRRSLRIRFRKNQKAKRSRSVDRFRRISSNFEEVPETRTRTLRSDTAAHSMSTTPDNDMDRLVSDLNHFHLQEDDNLSSATYTITPAANSRLNNCKMCDKATIDGDICPTCERYLRREFGL